MDTTLVTFHLKTSTDVFSVELLGSWDNFSKPYRLNRDALRGYGTWTGNYKFENIIFDGDRLEWKKPRTGGLKQGGRYWYYYRLDDEQEYCDSAQPISTDCPLLPGQTINVLDVPREIVHPPIRLRSASADFVCFIPQLMTLDPEDRYKKIEKPAPTKLPRHYVSTEALQPHGIQYRTSIDSSSPSTSTDSRRVESQASEQTWSDCSSIDPQSVPYAEEQDDPTPIRRTRRWNLKLPRLRKFGPSSVDTSPERPSTSTGAPSSSGASFESLGAFPMPPNHRRLPVRRIESAQNEESSLQNAQSSEKGLGIAIDDAADDAPLARGLDSSLRFNLDVFPERTSSRVPLPSFSQPWHNRHEPSDHASDKQDTSYPSPLTDAALLELSSPTFTADTMSTSGFNSPERLSYPNASESDRHCQVAIYEHEDLHHHNTPSMGEHTYKDESAFEVPTPQPPQSSHQHAKSRRLSFFRKDSAADSQSLADAIFGELRYLTRAIRSNERSP